MYNVYFDSGTSNTRAYLIKDFKMIDSLKAGLGSKDSSISRDSSLLIKGLKDIYDNLLERNLLNDKDIHSIYASGMVTCPHGIFEVPHLVTPVDLEKLCCEVYVHNENKFFKRYIRLIRGIKTVNEADVITMDSIKDVNNVRGEEIEVFGVIHNYPKVLNSKESFAVFMPGSHTHICYVKNNVIYDVLSTFTGELNYALSTYTVMAGELQKTENNLNRDMVLKGYKALKENGFCRAVYMAHASKVFDVIDDKSRANYLEGIIAGSVVDIFSKKIKNNWQDLKKVLIVGNKSYIQSYKIILDNMLDDVETIIIKQGTEPYSYQGFIQILKKGVG